MNYFDFYNIEESFFLSLKQLKKAYLELSRKYHPDFYAQDELAAKEKALEMSSINSKAFEILSDFDSRVKYILDLNDVLADEGQNKVPNDFLMEMMEINEALMELEFDPNLETKSSIKNDVHSLKDNLFKDIETEMMKYVKGADNAEEILKSVKEYYLKNRYLLRIEEKLL